MPQVCNPFTHLIALVSCADVFSLYPAVPALAASCVDLSDMTSSQVAVMRRSAVILSWLVHRFVVARRCGGCGFGCARLLRQSGLRAPPPAPPPVSMSGPMKALVWRAPRRTWTRQVRSPVFLHPVRLRTPHARDRSSAATPMSMGYWTRAQNPSRRLCPLPGIAPCCWCKS